MRKRLLAALIIILVYQTGCKEKSTDTVNQVKDSTQQQTFFPVTEYLKGQLREIDSLPVTPLKIVTTNGKEDSMWMKKEDIRPFAEPFLHPEIDTSNFKDLFTSRSFLDQTINSFTFSYDPSGSLPDTLSLKRWDVYIDPEKNSITRIYIIKEIKDNGIIKTLQLTWKSGKWCKITTITEQEGKPALVKEEMMKWDLSE